MVEALRTAVKRKSESKTAPRPLGFPRQTERLHTHIEILDDPRVAVGMEGTGQYFAVADYGMIAEVTLTHKH